MENLHLYMKCGNKKLFILGGVGNSKKENGGE
jgi:hypothetical protein